MTEQAIQRETAPYDLRAEQAVLAAAMVDPQHAWARVASLEPALFYFSATQVWFAAIQSLPNPDPITVSAWLTERGLSGECSLDYILRCLNEIPTMANLEHYIGIIEDRSLRRRLLNLSRRTEMLASAGDQSAAEVAATIATESVALTAAGARDELSRMADVVLAVIDEMDAAQKSRNPSGIKTGIIMLDALTGGLQPSDMIIIAGRPSEGKTALLLQLMAHIAGSTSQTGLLISREMTKKALARRLLAGAAGLDQFRMRSGRLTPAQWDSVTAAWSRISGVDLRVSDAPRQTLASIRAKALALKVEGNLNLVGIDYLQLIDEPRLKGESRAEQVGRISGGLKSLARELNVPVIVLSQLKRPEGGKTGAPDLEDLRESGAIEQDADVVGIIHTPDKDRKHENARPVNLILAKQRNGPTGKIPLMFDRARGIFDEPARRTDAPPAQNRMGEYDDKEGEHA